jgi:hypothetical protein
MPRHHRRVLDQLQGLIIVVGSCEALTCCIQVSMGVYGLQDPESQTRRLLHIGKDNLSGPSQQTIQHLKTTCTNAGFTWAEEHNHVFHHHL